MTDSQVADPGQPLWRPRRIAVHRHARMTRLTHWVNLLCVVVLLMSGLQIFNAHPALYWGQSGSDPNTALFEIGADYSGEGPPVGFTRLGTSAFVTTGILGLSRNAAGDQVQLGMEAGEYRGQERPTRQRRQHSPEG